MNREEPAGSIQYGANIERGYRAANGRWLCNGKTFSTIAPSRRPPFSLLLLSQAMRKKTWK